ncbi:hypothetical protein VTN77DRAFT_9679 [Rasamsonia byssochlamydoides]|uniref:uncharacterized protein n=1 Tax=Rasamsonia byssochlamydoides TaxID=89139 RepID=UPI003742F2F8
MAPRKTASKRKAPTTRGSVVFLFNGQNRPLSTTDAARAPPANGLVPRPPIITLAGEKFLYDFEEWWFALDIDERAELRSNPVYPQAWYPSSSRRWFPHDHMYPEYVLDPYVARMSREANSKGQ